MTSGSTIAEVFFCNCLLFNDHAYEDIREEESVIEPHVLKLQEN